MEVHSDPPPASNTDSSQMAADQSSWEKSWSMDEIRKSSANWSLAGDSGLLNFLQAFSQKLISESHGIDKDLSKLVQETKGTNSRLSNAVNDFLNLSNTQFVENRVYEEDIEETKKNEEKPETEEKSKQEKEAELIPKISSALNFGLAVIDSEFIKLELDPNDSDSDDEDVGIDASNLLEAKDPYVHRNLPVLIGSTAFMEDDFVGLQDEASDEEETEEPDEEESDKKSQSEDSDSYSESDSYLSDIEEQPSKKKIDNDSWDEGEDSDMFRSGGEAESGSFSSSSDEDDEKEVVKKEIAENDSDDETDSIGNANPLPPPKMDFNAELSKKLGLGASTPEDAPDSDVSHPTKSEKHHKKHRSSTIKSVDSHHTKEKRSSKSKGRGSIAQTNQDDGDAFAAENDVKSNKSKSKRRSSTKVKSTPSRSRASTAQNSEAGDMFAPEPEEDAFSPFSKKGGMFSGGGSLFDDSDDGGLFADESIKRKPSVKEVPKEKKKERSPSKSSTKTKGHKASSLFSDEDDDLFSSTKHRSSSVKSKSSSVAVKDRTNSDLFGENDDEPAVEPIQPHKEKSASGKMLPPGAVSVFGAGGLGNSLQAALKSRRAGGDSEEEESDESDDQPAVVPEVTETPSITPSSKQSKSKPASKPSSGLFENSVEDDGLFESTNRKNVTQQSKPVGGSSLFSDEDDDNLFSTKPNMSVSKPNVAKSKTQEKKSIPAKSSLFDKDDADDDLFTVAAKPKDSGKKKPTGGISLFGDDLFSPDKDKPPSKPVVKDTSDNANSESSKKNRSATALSLFDDDDDDDNNEINLFAPTSTKSSSSAKNMSSSKGLFEDSDNLFNDSKKDSPGVDLFAEKPKKEESITVKSNDATKASQVKARPAVTKSSIFDEDDDDDFMSPSNMVRDRPPSLLNEGFENSTEEVKKVPLKTSVSEGTDDKSDADNFAAKAPKKPAGAVSMFGGIDPFAVKKLKSPEKTSVPVSKAPVDEDDGLSSISQSKNEEPKPSSPMKIDINPTALLPGAKPPAKEFKEAAISLEDPPEANVLQSVNKDRAKVGVKRRPPSRKGRQTTARMSVADISVPASVIPEVTTKSEPSTPMKTPNHSVLANNITPPDFDDSDAVPTFTTSNLPDDIFSPDTEEEDLFAVAGSKSDLSISNDFSNSDMFPVSKKNIGSTLDDDLFSQKLPTDSSNQKKKDAVLQSDTKKDDFDDDIFNVGPTSKSSSKGRSPPADDDLFSIAPSKSANSNVNKNLPKDDVDDIFNVPSVSKTSSAAKSTHKNKENEESDTFSSKSSTTATSKSKPKPNLFADDVDDIFSDLSSSKKTTKSKKANKASLFADDDSDIFSSTPSSKPKAKSKVTKTTTKQSDQAQDIFDDPLMAGLK